LDGRLERRIACGVDLVVDDDVDPNVDGDVDVDFDPIVDLVPRPSGDEPWPRSKDPVHVEVKDGLNVNGHVSRLIVNGHVSRMITSRRGRGRTVWKRRHVDPSKDRCPESGPRQTQWLACDLRPNDTRTDDVRRTCAQLTILMLEPTHRWEILDLGSEIEIAWHRGGTEA
jgi:hypothetical protein